MLFSRNSNGSIPMAVAKCSITVSMIATPYINNKLPVVMVLFFKSKKKK
jgi:hypothetical protein